MTLAMQRCTAASHQPSSMAIDLTDSPRARRVATRISPASSASGAECAAAERARIVRDDAPSEWSATTHSPYSSESHASAGSTPCCDQTGIRSGIQRAFSGSYCTVMCHAPRRARAHPTRCLVAASSTEACSPPHAPCVAGRRWLSRDPRGARIRRGLQARTTCRIRRSS
jgi:hypothetical protein